MQLCLDLAARAAGRTSPNPLVGAAVVADSGEIIATGYHQAAGQAHAEVGALASAGERARQMTLYLNLEPCCHWGRTPPCVTKVIESGLKRVVVGMQDPNPAVAGGGIRALRDAGIDVVTGVLEKDCRYLNRGFSKWISRRMPWLCLKMASTLDGKIADRDGKSRWISGALARQHVQHLRDIFDCVLVGGTTAIRDNPQLTVKDIPGSRNPLRAIINPELTVSPDARVCLQAGEDKSTVIFAGAEAIVQRGSSFPTDVLLIPVRNASPSGLDLKEILCWLGARNVLTVLCEGGGRLAGALLEEDLVDEVKWFISPKLLPDGKAVLATAGIKPVSIEQSLSLQNLSIEQMDEDLLISGTLSVY